MQPPAADDDGVFAEPNGAPRSRRLGRVIEGRTVSIEPAGALVPPGCACCGADAATARAEKLGNAVLFVPYCEACRHHVTARTTRMLAVALASSLLALTLAGALPLLWERIPGAALTLFVFLGALLPVLAGGLRRRLPDPGHTATGRAVYWLPSGELACTSSRWASALADANGGEARVARIRDAEFSLWMLAGLVVAAVALPFFYDFYRPLVRIVNLTGTRLLVYVDGEPAASVEPTSAESSAAGVEVRMPAGQRRLEARDPTGAARATAEVPVHAASLHLYAPASDSYCFWIERTGYGRAGEAEGAGDAIEPLAGETRFWTLPGEIDSWFSPNPAAAGDDERSTGGVLTALRQAPCNALPRAVERALQTR